MCEQHLARRLGSASQSLAELRGGEHLCYRSERLSENKPESHHNGRKKDLVSLYRHA